MPPDSLTTDTNITLLFVFLGLGAWYLVGTVTENSVVEFGTLIGLGVVVPTLVNEWRRRSATD